jgi:hypothetical protein
MNSLKAAVSAARLLAESTGLSLKATASALALKAEIAIGFFLRQLFLADAGSVSDSESLDVSKNLSELPSATDQDVITLLKQVSDSGALTDDDLITIIKGLSETPAVAEAHVIAFTRPVADSGAIIDDQSLNAAKGLTEDPDADDSNIIEFTKIAGSVTDYDYCDITYFAEDYVEGPREDRAFAAESNVIDFTKFINEQSFATDDLDGQASTEDDQEIDFIKTRTEIASLSDLFTRVMTFARSFTESPSITDDPAITLDKPIADASAATDTFSKVLTFNRSFSDSGAMADSEIKDASKNLSENGGIIDSQVVQFTKDSSDSGVASDSGSLRSQGYCDFTYFAEDYVGASRTFT